MDDYDTSTSRTGDPRPEARRQNAQPAEPEVGVARIESDDVLEYTHLLRPWDVEIEQLSPGPFDGSLEAVKTPSMLLYSERWARRAQVRGSNPPGYILIGAHLAWRRSPLTWCSADLGPRTLACAAPASEIGFTAPCDSHHAVVLVTPEFLEQGLGTQAVDRLSSSWGLEVGDRVGLDFGQHIIRVVRRAFERPEALSRPLEIRSIESDLMDVLIRCLGAEAAASVTTDPSNRARALDAALEHARSCRGRTTAHELSIAAGVSQRTLERAFRERLGITPGVFLRLKRLNAAHRELLASDPRMTTVWRVASGWDFRHQGRFSVLHRRVFGESPSRTLRRSRPSSRRSLSDVFSLAAG